MLSWDAGPESNAVSQDLVQEAVAAASLTDVLLKLTGEAGFSFLEPMIRWAALQPKRRPFCMGRINNSICYAGYIVSLFRPG